MDGERIIAGMGEIENDFHDKKELAPNICAVYTEKEYRGKDVMYQRMYTIRDQIKAAESIRKAAEKLEKQPHLPKQPHRSDDDFQK